jgi:ferredoxin
MPERWTVVVDRDACMGTGTCMVYAPGTLEFDADGKATLRPDHTEHIEAVRAAVEACPTSALRIVGDES